MGRMFPINVNVTQARVLWSAIRNWKLTSYGEDAQELKELEVKVRTYLEKHDPECEKIFSAI